MLRWSLRAMGLQPAGFGFSAVPDPRTSPSRQTIGNLGSSRPGTSRGRHGQQPARGTRAGTQSEPRGTDRGTGMDATSPSRSPRRHCSPACRRRAFPSFPANGGTYRSSGMQSGSGTLLGRHCRRGTRALGERRVITGAGNFFRKCLDSRRHNDRIVFDSWRSYWVCRLTRWVDDPGV